MPVSFGSFLAGQEKNITHLFATERYMFLQEKGSSREEPFSFVKNLHKVYCTFASRVVH